ncbi:polysaccharide biosynthesis/export family protein [Terriglobus albidus]|uniref:polysaccharide biosynthesis/export family protein n=1 Tax=Terriglobus albidus TaxID=1592106 RepID=UPI0021DFCB41|nr:polysaccharide biosynthesis/export family protein [Terriglobus albidus]
MALPEDFSQLRLGPGFKLQMSVFSVPEMSQDLSVDDGGAVSIPLIGDVRVVGLTLHQAEKKIEAELDSQQMLVKPHVSLVISAFPQQPVLVAGEVQTPGKVQILAPRPVLDLIASAGGVTTAAGGEIEIHHLKDGFPAEVRRLPYANGRDPDEARTALVYPGDTVFVRRAGVIYVLGAVAKPGGYLMVNGGKLALSEVVSLAGGTTVVASTKHAIVVRKEGESIRRIDVPLKDMERGREAPFALAEGDMVFIPSSKIKSALVNSSTILSSAVSATIYTVR